MPKSQSLWSSSPYSEVWDYSCVKLTPLYRNYVLSLCAEVHGFKLPFSWYCDFKIQPCSSCLYNGSLWVDTCMELTSLCRDLIRVWCASWYLDPCCWLSCVDCLCESFSIAHLIRRKLSRTFYGYVLHMLFIVLIKSLLWWNLAPEFALPIDICPNFTLDFGRTCVACLPNIGLFAYINLSSFQSPLSLFLLSYSDLLF